MCLVRQTKTKTTEVIGYQLVRKVIGGYRALFDVLDSEPVYRKNVRSKAQEIYNRQRQPQGKPGFHVMHSLASARKLLRDNRVTFTKYACIVEVKGEQVYAKGTSELRSARTGCFEKYGTTYLAAYRTIIQEVK